MIAEGTRFCVVQARGAEAGRWRPRRFLLRAARFYRCLRIGGAALGQKPGTASPSEREPGHVGLMGGGGGTTRVAPYRSSAGEEAKLSGVLGVSWCVILGAGASGREVRLVRGLWRTGPPETEKQHIRGNERNELELLPELTSYFQLRSHTTTGGVMIAGCLWSRRRWSHSIRTATACCHYRRITVKLAPTWHWWKRGC